MATDDVYNLAIEQLLNGRPVVNTFSFRRKTSAEPVTADFAAVAAFIGGKLEPNQVDDLSYTAWRATQVRGAGATYSTTPPFLTTTVAFSGGFSPAIAGDLTQSPLPNNVAICATVQTGQSGRRRQGRFFIGGIAETWVDDNSIVNATQLATLQSYLNDIITTYGSGGSSAAWELGVYSMRIATNAKYVWTTSGPVLTSQGTPDPANAFMAAVAIQARNFVASQRDRRPGL